jgi:predicted dehydrogenase
MAGIRWGVLSTANIAIRQVIPAIQASERCEVVAIASRNLGRAEKVAQVMNIERAYGSYGQLLHDDAVDAVYIPLPNHMHAEWSVAAARAGKHVLCEKPIALTTAEAEKMAAAAAETGVILREAFMYQFHPTWQRAKELVDAGEIGTVMAIDSWFSFFNDDPDNIRNVVDYGGGALMDIGCYCIHLSRLIYGSEPTAIKATVRRDPESGVDIATAGVLEFGDGIATFGCSTRAEPDQRVDIYGTQGRIGIEIPFNIPADRSTRISITAGGDPPVDPSVVTLEFEPANEYTLQADAFAAAILDGASLPDTGADAVNNIKVIERVFAATGPSGWT